MQQDADLIQDVLAGRRDAYTELVRRHERSLLAAAGAVLGNLHSAEDAAQEAFVIAFRKLRTLRNGNAFGAWAVSIARHLAVSMIRRERRIRPIPDCVELPAERPDDRLDELTARVLKAVERLPDKQARAILLKYFAGHTAEQIAQMTGQQVGTVHSQVSRGIARLRNRLKETEQ